MPLMSGAVPQSTRSLAALGAVRQLGVLLVDQTAQVQVLDLLFAACLLLQCAGVVGDGALQDGGQVEDERNCQKDRHHACGDADLALAAAEGGDPFGDPAACKGEEQQRQGGANGEGQRQRHRVQPDRAGGSCDDDRCQNRTRARHVQDAERKAEAETVAAAAELLLRKLGERLLEHGFEPREDQSEPDRHQRDQCHPAHGVLGQVQKGEQRRTEQGDDAEAQHQTCDHQIGPQSLRPRRPHLGRDAATSAASRTLCVPEKKMTGNTGRMHGEIPVISPPMKPMSDQCGHACYSSPKVAGLRSSDPKSDVLE